MLSSWFKSKRSALVGIDIGSTCAQAILLAKEDKHYKIELVASVPIDLRLVVDNAIVDVHVVANLLKRIKDKLPKQVTHSVAGVSGFGVISKTIVLNSVDNDEELQAQIELEADSLFPFPLDEVSIDFEVLGRNQFNENKIDVLLTAARTELVTARASALELAGLAAKIMDVESYALGRAYCLVAHQVPDNEVNAPIALIDVGANMLTVAIVVAGRTVFVKEQAFGGEQLTQIIKRDNGVGRDEAESIKCSVDTSDTTTVSLHSFYQQMAKKIRRILQIYSSGNNASAISRIILSGGCAFAHDIENTLSNELEINTVVAQPFKHCIFSDEHDREKLVTQAPRFMIACGLALRSFD
ncbi:MAG: type IV pilus assembly protein PilM [Psychrobium sp.]|nr:type IV pilus assembly protein PilM [Psychrobium sp.]